MSLYRNRFTALERKRKSEEIASNKLTAVKSAIIKEKFESDLKVLENQACKEVYYNHKLTHQGIVTYKTFEGYYRKRNKNSLANLLNYKPDESDVWRDGKPFDEAFGVAVKDKKDYRRLDKYQVRKCKSACQKLSYYSGTRELISKKSGKYKFKVGFLTLTAPSSANYQQILKAFEGFLDYLRRTANCAYVWKKEIGEKSGLLHFHLIVNNVVPYYIVSWKWKRLLIAQGVEWAKNDKGLDTNSHSKIEIPHSAKQVARYVSKYVSKECELPVECGFIWGCSEIIKECKELILIEGEVSNDELWNITKSHKSISTDYVSILCCDLLKVKNLAPMLYNIFLKQYYSFKDNLTLPQRFFEV